MKIKNVNPVYTTVKYVVYRTVEGIAWYYGGTNDLIQATKAAKEIGNGGIIESEKVEPVGRLNPWA